MKKIMSCKMENKWFSFRRAVMLIVGVACVAGVFAQAQISIPYSYSFEDTETTENGEWVMDVADVPGEEYDVWHRGSATFSDGQKSLYISHDGGVNPFYGRQKGIVVAYRRISMRQGTYILTFDWKNNAAGNSGMYVCLLPDGTPPSSVWGTSLEPQWLKTYPQQIQTASGTTKCLKGAREWENATMNMPIGYDMTVYLAFVWKNDGDSIYPPLAACVDNIQITSADCTPPSNLKVDARCDTVDVSWSGTSEKYTLEYRQNGTSKWSRVNNIYNATTYRIEGIEEGIYDFRVRGICNDTVESAWATRTGELVFCADNHCINYVDLENNPDITCWVGTAGKEDSWSKTAPIDFGPDQIESRHAVCWARNQYDPRTNYALPTIPDGEFASIRLGNWDNNSQADRIDFEYHVDSTAMVLILKYAIVFEDPQGHSETQKPYFSMSILDEDGYPIDADCGSASFYADATRAEDGWHTEYDIPGSSEPISWKEWTTIGVNMTPYAGEDIVIRLETQDCTLGAHYGYAYFTLGCASGTIESVSCGAEPTMDIKAPDGFDYVWFTTFGADSVPVDTLYKGQTYNVPASDKTTYWCRCLYKENPDCFFDLHTVVSPREPFAQFSYELVPENCENKVRFINESHVITIDDETGQTVHTAEETQTAYWDFGTGEAETMSNPVMTFPNEGDTIEVTLVAGISNGQCEDDTTVTVIIPSIITPERTIDSTICYNDFVVWGGKYIMSQSGLFADSSVNVAGCDSITWLNLTVLPEIEERYDTATICYGEEYEYNGREYDESGDYPVWLTTAHGCDSVVNLHLIVRDEVTFDVEKEDVGDEPNTGEIRIEDAPAGYTWSVNGEEGGALTGLAGGTYKVVVYDAAGCPSDTAEVFIDQECLVVEMAVDSMVTACADDEAITIGCELPEGYPSYYRVEYGDEAKAAGFENMRDTLEVYEVRIVIPDSCRPGRYAATVVMEDRLCGEQNFPVEFEIHYASSVVRQKWNNVLAVTNAGYNGGYEFAAFQWYRNGSPLTGEVGSYLYLGEGEALDVNDTYYVMLTRADDGVTLPTCPITPTVRTDVSEYPMVTVAAAGSPMRIMNVEGEATVRLYNAAGALYSATGIDEMNAEVMMPAVPGVYVMMIERDGTAAHYKIVVR